ncbi:MAG TPA: carbohydrate ABC transporter permease [Candidatus Dormibacteraeota bacterium]|jgi:multiple sugar transport system permease protein|nr:carbohydrate ABC transporter permease [Candidatus Dormibacteraeota bacterium]
MPASRQAISSTHERRPDQLRAAWFRARRRLGRLGWTIVAAIVVPFFAAPLVWMLAASLKQDAQVFSIPIQWIPHPFEWGNIRATLDVFPFVSLLINTVIITFAVIIGTVASSALVGFGLSRIEWPGRNIVFYIVLATMILPTYVTIIPLFALFSRVGWVDTFYPLIVPSFFGANGFSIFLVRQFLMRQPQELYDAARVDGAGFAYQFWAICVPLATPALAVVGLFAFIWTWTDFFLPLVYLTTPSKFTLMLGLQYLHGQHATLWPQLMLANSLIVLPVMIVFLFAQRTFVQGIHLTGIR